MYVPCKALEACQTWSAKRNCQIQTKVESTLILVSSHQWVTKYLVHRAHCLIKCLYFHCWFQGDRGASLKDCLAMKTVCKIMISLLPLFWCVIYTNMVTFQVTSKDLIHSMCTDLHMYSVVAGLQPEL